MARETLTGSRIRERRLIAGMRQADLARSVGISASYLNLIEHNRRRIGGKLLISLAQAMGVEPSTLTEGAEAALLASLREAAAEGSVPAAEIERAEEFAGRFPGWADLTASYHRRIEALEQTVQTLSDRLTHDPHLAASLHEVLSTAASIRSTASILAETDELEAEWQDRFHRNINQDAERLADSSRALVKFLDEGTEPQVRKATPQEEVEAFLNAHAFHFPELELSGAETSTQEIIENVLKGSGDLGSVLSKELARHLLFEFVEDAQKLPFEGFVKASQGLGFDPFRLQQHFGQDMGRVMRRLATLPSDVTGKNFGFLQIDGSGAILFRKPVTGFSPAGFGMSCPLWPIYMAFQRPMQPVRKNVRIMGRSATDFECFAYSWPHKAIGNDGEPLFRAAMIVHAVDPAHSSESLLVGGSCRICPRGDCDARREPSILAQEF